MVVRNGVEALDYLFGTGSYAGQEAKPKPELILLDLKLPKIWRPSAAAPLAGPRSARRRIPVIVLTSSSDEKRHAHEPRSWRKWLLRPQARHSRALDNGH